MHWYTNEFNVNYLHYYLKKRILINVIQDFHNYYHYIKCQSKVNEFTIKMNELKKKELQRNK